MGREPRSSRTYMERGATAAWAAMDGQEAGHSFP